MKYKKILDKYGNDITSIKDLTGGDYPESFLFRFLAPIMAKELKPYDDNIDRRIKLRRIINPVLKRLAPLFLAEKQIIVDKDELLGDIKIDNTYDSKDESVIYVSNHGFMDDVFSSVLASKGHTYFVTNAIPEMCNTLDGFLSWINGVVLTNHRVRHTKRLIVDKCVTLLENNTNIVIFPEGVWNKTPNKLLIDLWPGVYHMACRSKRSIVPIIHYIDDFCDQSRNNIIHTVVGYPIRIDHLEEKQALQFLRNNMATYYWLLMDRYGHTTRKQLLKDNLSSNDEWERQLIKRTTALRYDFEMETSSDYRSKNIVYPIDVWKPVADIKNITKYNLPYVVHAIKVINDEYLNDFQRRI